MKNSALPKDITPQAIEQILRDIFKNCSIWRSRCKDSGQPRLAKKDSEFFEYSPGLSLEAFLSGMARQDYEQKNKEYNLNKDTYCRLCNGIDRDGLLFWDSLVVVPDVYPFFPYHMLIFHLNESINKNVVDDENVPMIRKIRLNSCNIDHRDYFLEKDFEDMAKLACFVPNFMVTQALRGSGASVPEHIHAHFFPQDQTDFPLLNRKYFQPFSKIKDVWVNRTISYIIAFSGTPRRISRAFSILSKTCGLPANHIIRVDPSFDCLVGFFVPRIKEVPDRPVSFRRVDWRFGVFEVLGLYDVKTPELFHRSSLKDYCQATKDVTLQNIEEQKRLEKSIEELIDL